MKDAGSGFRRAANTLTLFSQLLSPDEGEARRAAARINAAHQRVQGTVDGASATDRFPEGTPYSALNPELLRWVLGVTLWTRLSARERIDGALSPAERDAYCRAVSERAAFIRVPADKGFANHDALRTYLDDRIRNREVVVTDAVRKIADRVLGANLPGPFRPFSLLTHHAKSLIAAAFLPEPIRKQYDLPWNRARELEFRALTPALRLATPHLPRIVRYLARKQAAAARGESRQR